MNEKKRIILAITGGSGVVIGMRILQVLKDNDIETHLIISPGGYQTIEHETNYTQAQIQQLAYRIFTIDNFMAPIASGSFRTNGMIIIPCTIETLSGIAQTYATNLIIRSADVCLKEGRPLLLAINETPLHSGHIRQMKQANAAGAIIFPLAPSFYSKPKSIKDIIDHLAGRMLDRLGITNSLFKPWQSKN